MIKALLMDMDNTIFPTPSIAEEVFAGVYDLMDEYRGDLSDEKFEEAKTELSRTPFHQIADHYGFGEEFKRRGTDLLKETTVKQDVAPFEEYALLQACGLPKFLVTFGFSKLQQSKIDRLGVRDHFEEVFVVDPELSSETKRDVFKRIMERYGYGPDELLAVGDDPASEIKAAEELGIPTYLYDPEGRFEPGGATYHEPSYQRLKTLLEQQG